MTTGSRFTPNVSKVWSGANGRKHFCNKYDVQYVFTEKLAYSPDARSIHNSGWNGIQTMLYRQLSATARNKALRELDEQINSNILAFAEFYYMRDLAATCILRFIKVAKAARKLRRLAVRNIPFGRADVERNAAAIPAAWLEFNFVYKPAVKSFNEFANIMNGPFPITYGKVYGKDKGAMGEIVDPYTPRWVYEMECKTQYHYAYHYPNPNAGLLARLGFMNFAGNAWDIVPWSWAVDYFVNAGELLSNLQPRFPGVEFTQFYSSSTTKQHVLAWARGDPEWWNPEKARPFSWKTLDFGRSELDPNRLKYEPEFNLVSSIQRLSQLTSAIALNLRRTR